jgi:hypothetical protein
MEGNAQFSRILATFPFCKKCKKSFRPFLLQGRRRPFPPPTGLLPPSPPPPQAKPKEKTKAKNWPSKSSYIAKITTIMLNTTKNINLKVVF